MKRHADTDQQHDDLLDRTDVVTLTPAQAEAATILGWPVTAYRSGPRARLSPHQQQVLSDLCQWHDNGAENLGAVS